jgi:hypothetical protein
VTTRLSSNGEVGDLTDILDQCLEQLNKGQSVEDCLAPYPAIAVQLAPLLRLAQQIAALRQDEQPSPAALQAARQKVLREAVRLSDAHSGKSPLARIPWRLSLQPILRRSMAAVLAASLLLVMLLGTGAVAASANSLPGDALYPVKRASEEVRLLLAFDQQTKAQLQHDMDERRIEEAKAVADSQRVVELAFRGRVEQMQDGRWTVSGVSIEISPDTVIEGRIALGDQVQVQVRSLSDGTLQALSVSREPQELAPLPTATPTEPEPTATLTASVTPTRVPPPTSAPAQPAQPTQPPATSTAQPTFTPRPTFTSTPTITPVPPTPVPPRDVKVRFRGRIEALAANSWTVDGQVIRIDANTRVDEQDGQAVIGAMALVVAIRLDDGALLAVEIKIEPAPQEAEQPFEFQGIIESYGPGQWVVGGHTLIITGSTIIENSPQRGLLAEVKALRQTDGSLVADHIWVRLPTEVVQFEGVVLSLHAGEWVVDGVTVRFDEQSVIIGVPVVGAQVEVEGLLLPDDAVLARRIVVQAEVSAPTSTLQPEQLPTPTSEQALPSETAPQPASTAAPTIVTIPCDGCVIDALRGLP